MPKGMFEVPCPCCAAILKIDPETRAVIAHTVPVKPAPIEDLASEVAKLKGEGARPKSYSESNSRPKRRTARYWKRSSTSFFKRAKADPDQTPPKRDIDLD